MQPPAIVTVEDFRRAMPWLEAALEYTHGSHNLADVHAEIEAQRAQFWIWERSALVTQITALPRLKQLHFWLAGGDLEELKSVEPGVTAWGREQGCTRVSLSGRPGWRKAMAPLGYKPSYETIYRELA